MPLSEAFNVRVVVLDEDFAEYQQLLAQAGVPAEAGDDPAAVSASCDVLLAQPDLASAYLELGGEVPWIQSTWAGIDKLIPTARGSKLVVTGVKEVFGPQMAEYVFAFLLQESRSLEFYRCEQSLRQWSPRRPQSLAGQAMTILGTGTIGSHIAAVARTFGIETRGVSRSAKAVATFDSVYSMDHIVEAGSGAQVLVNTLPATPETRGVLRTALLDALDASATLFNIGRGDALCESSLRGWLDRRPESMAVLDVFDSEPLPEDHWMWQHAGVRITPHVAAVSFPEDLVKIFLDNLLRSQRNAPLRYVIDLERGY